MDMTGVVEESATLTGGESTEKTEPQGTPGTEKVGSDNGNTASGEQSTAEGNQSQEERRQTQRPSKLDTIRELRAERREREAQMQTLQDKLDEMQKQFTQRTEPPKARKTFWEAPEEVLEERLKADRQALRDEILNHLDKRDTTTQQTAEWRQETSEASKFIESQKGVAPEDHEDIAELIRSTPAMMQMRPLDRAKYALFLWKEMRGITDKTEAKNRASTVVGAPQSRGGQKVWTQSEIDAKIDSFPKDQRHWTAENKAQFDAFEREVKEAMREGRVK